MSPSAAWLIESLTKKHDRSCFDCGVPPLNEFIKKHARQQQEQRFNRTFVAVKPDDADKTIFGFYTLSAAEISLSRLPPDLYKKLPKHPVPVARIGRLAVDLSTKGKKLGAFLLRDALIRCADLSRTDLGLFAVIVDAKDESACSFYRHYGFIPFVDNRFCLFIPIKTILAQRP